MTTAASTTFSRYSRPIKSFALLFLSVISFPAIAADLLLAPGVVNTTQFGWRWSNAEPFRNGVTAEFDSTGVDLVLSVVGYDIDKATEVSVILNGDILGYLPIGVNNRRSSAVTFSIPETDQIIGTNSIEFRPRTSGSKWGVTDLLITQTTSAPDINLVPNVVDTTSYGWRWGNAVPLKAAVTAEFENTAVDFELSVVGYDIDSVREVSVNLNGELLGYLPVGTNNRKSSVATFSIPVALQISGTNSIEFRQRRSGWKWGVTNIALNNNGSTTTAAPVAVADNLFVLVGSETELDVLANDIANAPLDSATISIKTPGREGDARVVGNRIVYLHRGTSEVDDEFTYSVTDASGQESNVVTATLAINLAPYATTDTFTVTRGTSTTIDILANDADPDIWQGPHRSIDPNSVVLLPPDVNDPSQAPLSGTVVFNTTNFTVDYTHDGSAGDAASFLYTVADLQGAVSLAQVFITVQSSEGGGDTEGPQNAAPTANADSFRIPFGAPQQLAVLSNDSDTDGDLNVSSVVIVQPPSSGTAEPQINGSVLYTHNSNNATTDSFTYTVSDDAGRESAAVKVDIEIISGGTVGGITAFHRDGQTFLTWDESSPFDGYHIYRSSTPITTGNLSSAQRITGKWGPLDNNTSVNSYKGHTEVPTNFVINDLAPALSDDQGLFVYTKQAQDSNTAYYGVTSVANGIENRLTVQVSNRVTESVSDPTDVLTVSRNNGKGRIYTQFMDYSNWNPTLNGYAYNYAVALPFDYNTSQSYPLMIAPHAYGELPKFHTEAEYNWQVIQLFPYDPGGAVGTIHSWWYGYSADHNYLTSNNGPTSGTIENFTEQRIMRATRYLRSSNDYNIDDKRIHAYGNSMGASGVVSLAMRYPSVLAGVFASQPMTNYRASTVFADELRRLWGTTQDNLPIVNGGTYDDDIRLYGENGVVAVGVWDWMNHQKQLVDRRGDNFAYLMMSHGKSDGIIEWNSQGSPIVQALTSANAGFSAVANGSTHGWSGFDAVVNNLFGFGNGDEFTWKYPVDMSFPAIQNADRSGGIPPDNNSGNTETYNLDFEWATEHNPFDDPIIDLSTRYEITIKSTSQAQSADITPRRARQFQVNANTRCNWSATNRNNGNTVGSGNVTADNDALVTVPNVIIMTGAGTRLAITCP